MNSWKRNLIFCWFGMFVTMVGISQVAPILPLYIKELGVQDTTLIERFSGIAFGGYIHSFSDFFSNLGKTCR